MTTEAEIEDKFWKTLRSDMTVMLGLDGADDLSPRPMTAQIDDEAEDGSIWFFTAIDTELATRVTPNQAAMFTLAGKGHDLFASVRGRISIDTDRAVIERLWNPFVAAWYEGGKDDPKLVLLRFDPDTAEIWLNESNIWAGLKMLLGADPKDDYEDKVAKVALS